MTKKGKNSTNEREKEEREGKKIDSEIWGKGWRRRCNQKQPKVVCISELMECRRLG